MTCIDFAFRKNILSATVFSFICFS